MEKQKKIRNEDKYTLEFHYIMSQEEIIKEDRFRRNRNLILGVLMFLCCGVSYFQGQAIQQQEEADNATQVAINNTESVYASQTATLWTITPTFTLTSTPTNTNIPSPTMTHTAIASRTSIPSDTPQPTNIPQSTNYYVLAQANIRDCPQIECTLINTYFAGTALEIIDTNVIGDAVNGDTRWMQGVINGEIFYVHSSLVSLSRPIPTAVPQASTNNNSSTNNANSQAVQPVSTPRNCDEAVARGLTAVEAAQYSHLDADEDGVACYGD